MAEPLAYHSFVSDRDDAVLGIAFSHLTRDRLVRRMLFDAVPKGEGARLLVTANVDHISNLVRNARFRAAYANAWMSTADGMPVYLYAKLRGSAAPERVTGADLFVALLGKMVPNAWNLFFVASNEETGRRIKAKLVARGFDPSTIAYACPAFGYENDPAQSAALARAIREHGTTHLFFGLGAPKSEVWIHEHRELLGDCYALAIGASLDFYVGQRRRAPLWMQDAGLEWAWRLLSEPRRLFRRYCVESWYAVWAMATDMPLARDPVPAYELAPPQKAV